MTTLTAQQKDAVECQSNLLLTACPGSGKTRTLTAKLITEIEGVRGSPKRICCITYTNSAVQEIEGRAEQQLQQGDDRFFYAATIHAFCFNEIIRPFGWLLPNFRGIVKILTRESADFEEIADHAARQIGLFSLTSRDYEAFEALAVDSKGKVVGLAAENEPIKLAARHFWDRCAVLGYTDFGMLIYNAYRLIRDHPKIAKSICARYAWFLIDEFQDTTELQIEILKLLYATGRSRFFAVGDLAQSIYSFTGARPELVEPFAASIGARTDLSLTGNFRSSQKIVAHAERLFPRRPAMTAEGSNKLFPLEPELIRGMSAFQAITENFLPKLAINDIPLGEATILAKDWASLFSLTRQLREFGTPVVGPGARPYRRSRLFATLAEQLCGLITDPQPENYRQLDRALFHAVQDATGTARFDIFGYAGRLVIVRLLRAAKRQAENFGGAMQWLDAMSMATGEILKEAEFVDAKQSGLFPASAHEMKRDMERQHVDIANLSIEDLGLFASPTKALRLSTIHYSKGREYSAVAIIGLRQGNFPHFRSTDVEAEKRLFYVAVTRAEKLLMYVAEQDSWESPPSQFLGPAGVAMFGAQRS